MDIQSSIFFITFSAIAVSYGWGMRGTIIGGEKGAMLPGAFMGLLIAVFSGSEVLASSPWILAGAGAIGMYCGGCMTYGETLHLSMHEPNSPTLKKGLVALFVKGGIWFGIFGGFVSMFITAIAGQYELWQIILFFCLLPLFAIVFYFILNHPHNPEENKFPKIYFSIKRKESWGGLLGILTEIILFAVIFKDWSCIAMTLGSFLFGAVGWVIAQMMQIRAKHPGKNGKRLFEVLQKKDAVESWKLMECTLGAIGGIGCAVTFILAKPLFAEKLATIDANGFHSYLADSEISFSLFIIYVIILCVDCIQYYIPEKTVNYKKIMKTFESAEFALYSVLPLFLCMIGVHKVASLAALPIVLHVLVQELMEKSNDNGKTTIIDKILFMLPFILTTIFITMFKDTFGTISTLFVYSVVYEVAYFRMKAIEEDKIKFSNGEKAVHGYFITCCVLIMIMSIFI